MEYVVSSSGMFLIEGLRYVGLVLFEEGLDLFSPLMESSFRALVLLLAASDLLLASDLLFQPPLVMANGGGRSYVRFNP